MITFQCGRSLDPKFLFTWPAAEIAMLGPDKAVRQAVQVMDFCMYQGIWKGESGLFLTPVLTLWGGGHIDHHVWRGAIVPSGFGAIIQCDLRTYSLLCDSLYACVIHVHAEKPIHAKQIAWRA